MLGWHKLSMSAGLLVAAQGDLELRCTAVKLDSGSRLRSYVDTYHLYNLTTTCTTTCTILQPIVSSRFYVLGCTDRQTSSQMVVSGS